MAENNARIQELYLRSQDEIKEQFLSQEHPQLLLADFFEQEFFDTLAAHLLTKNLQKEYLPHKFSYSTISLADPLLIRTVSLVSDYFSSLFSLSHPAVELRVFDAGDYTLLEDDMFADDSIDIILDLTDSSVSLAAGDEDEGNFGGFLCCTSSDEELCRFSPQSNACFMLHNKEGAAIFFKYLSKRIKNKKRVLLILSYTL